MTDCPVWNLNGGVRPLMIPMQVAQLILFSLFGVTIPHPEKEFLARPQFSLGQEMTWKGTFEEETYQPGNRVRRQYEFQSYLFVWSVQKVGPKESYDLALLSVLRRMPTDATMPFERDKAPTSARLQLVRLDAGGMPMEEWAGAMREAADLRLTRKRNPLTPPGRETVPLPELGMLPTWPEEIPTGQQWSRALPNRGTITSRYLGYDQQRGTRTQRISSQVQTENWEQSIAPQLAWREIEDVQISASQGWVLQLERTYERRDAQSGEVNFRQKLQYNYAGQLRFSGRSFEERREEIQKGVEFGAILDSYQADPARTMPTSYAKLLAQMDHYTKVLRPLGETLPYREVFPTLKTRAESSMKGHIRPVSWTQP